MSEEHEFAAPYKGSHDTAADSQEILEQEGIPYLLCYNNNGMLRVETTFTCCDRLEEDVPPEDCSTIKVMQAVRFMIDRFIDEYIRENVSEEEYAEHIRQAFIHPDELKGGDDEEESWKKGE